MARPRIDVSVASFTDDCTLEVLDEHEVDDGQVNQIDRKGELGEQLERFP
jgi:hypothetical protein